jgi:hypothetical protein
MHFGPCQVVVGKVTVATGYAALPHENVNANPPRHILERNYNVVHYTKMSRGSLRFGNNPSRWWRMCARSSGNCGVEARRITAANVSCGSFAMDRGCHRGVRFALDRVRFVPVCAACARTDPLPGHGRPRLWAHSTQSGEGGTPEDRRKVPNRLPPILGRD